MLSTVYLSEFARGEKIYVMLIYLLFNFACKKHIKKNLIFCNFSICLTVPVTMMLGYWAICSVAALYVTIKRRLKQVTHINANQEFDELNICKNVASLFLSKTVSNLSFCLTNLHMLS